MKAAARERMRIEQGKKGWWKDFNWCVGVMVEKEYDGEWWDAIVIKVILPSPAASVGSTAAASKPLTQTEGATGEEPFPGPDHGIDSATGSLPDAPGADDAMHAEGAGDAIVDTPAHNAPGTPGRNPDDDAGDATDGKLAEVGEVAMAKDGKLIVAEQAARDSAVAKDGKLAGDSPDPSHRRAEEAEGWEAGLAYMVENCPGPRITYPKDWPSEGIYICNEDDRPVDVARKHRVNLERLVRLNKKQYPGLTKTSPLKASTALKLPLPMDIKIGSEPAPPPDPLGVGLVLIHYVGGEEEDTEWVFCCSKKMRPSADKLWNAVAVEAAEEMVNVLAPDPGAWKKHCFKVLKRARKNYDLSWPFWEPVDPVAEGLEDYHEIIERPMCLDMVEADLKADKLSSPVEFAANMRLIFNNAMVYNPPDHNYHQLAEKMLAFFEEAWVTGHEGNNWGQPFGAASGSTVSLLKDPGSGVTSGQTKRKYRRASADKDAEQRDDGGDGAEGDHQGEEGEIRAPKRKYKRASTEPERDGGQEHGLLGEDDAAQEKKPKSFMDRRITLSSRSRIKVCYHEPHALAQLSQR